MCLGRRGVEDGGTPDLNGSYKVAKEKKKGFPVEGGFLQRAAYKHVLLVLLLKYF